MAENDIIPLTKAGTPDMRFLSSRRSLGIKSKYKANRKYAPRKIDPKKVLRLAKQGTPAKDIAIHQNVDPSTIYHFLNRHFPEYHQLKAYKENRADVYAFNQMITDKALAAVVRSINVDLEDPDEVALSKTSLEQKSNIALKLTTKKGIEYDKERTEREKAGVIVDIHAIVAAVRGETR